MAAKGRGYYSRAKKVEYDGILFDSGGECERYRELKLLEYAKQIMNLRVHEKYDLTINGMKISSYKPDFCYTEKGEEIAEDWKGSWITPEAKLRLKIFAACYQDIKLVIRTVDGVMTYHGGKNWKKAKHNTRLVQKKT